MFKLGRTLKPFAKVLKSSASPTLIPHGASLTFPGMPTQTFHSFRSPTNLRPQEYFQLKPLKQQSSFFHTVITPPPAENRFEGQMISEMVAQLTPLQKKSLGSLLTGGMSYGALSDNAHRAIASGVNQLAMAITEAPSIDALKKQKYRGPKSNSGEGGERKTRNNTIEQSMIRQAGSAGFGINRAYLAHVLALEIKFAQGAKPGFGGELPGKKVTPAIAEVRLTVPGVELGSPAPQHLMYSIEDLRLYIRNLRSANPHARIKVKLGAGDPNWLSIIAAGAAKAGADEINIAGPGGTGAAPLPAKHDIVHPWEPALAIAHQILVEEDLRSSVELTTSGGIQTGLDVFKAHLLGANTVEVGTAVAVYLGCIMAEVCQKGTCPTGIATTNQTLVDRTFKGTPEDVARGLIYIAIELASYLERYGFTDPQDAVGRVDLLQVKQDTPLTGLERLLYKSKKPSPFKTEVQKDPGSSDEEKGVIWNIGRLRPGLETAHFEIKASNLIMSFGARISYYLETDEAFNRAFYQQPVRVTFNGTAVGQSLGFVAPDNLTLVASNAPNGVGTFLDGATIVIKEFAADLVGFGATRGQIMVQRAGGRLGTRNSGADLIAGAIGPDGIGFMTRGSFTLLANAHYYPGLYVDNTKPQPIFPQAVVGSNFGSGFTGGVAFLPIHLYKQMLIERLLASSALEIEPQALSESDCATLADRLKAYHQEIPTPLSAALLGLDAESLQRYFIKLDPQKKRPSAVISAPDILRQAITELETFMPQAPVVNTLELVQPGARSTTQPTTGMYDKTKAEKDACGTGVVYGRTEEPGQQVVKDAIEMLARFEHRGASGVDPNTGDGCGITWFMLHPFFQAMFPGLHLEKDAYAIVHMALPQHAAEKIRALQELRRELDSEGLTIIGERETPVDSTVLGYIGRSCEPSLYQYIVNKPSEVNQETFENKLIRARLRFTFIAQMEKSHYTIQPHIISASSRYVIYKTMAKEAKIGDYFKDFDHPMFKAVMAIVHARFSTNTLPTFMNIQPFSSLANNGENNAIQLIINSLLHDPILKTMLGLSAIELKGFSDSHIMSIYMDMLYLMGYSAEQIINLTIHRYDPLDGPSSSYYNLFGTPFEGPNASIINIGPQGSDDQGKVGVVRDRSGFRPQMVVVNPTFFYSGSEFTLDRPGETFGLRPAEPMMIDRSSNSIHVHQLGDVARAFHQKQMSCLLSCMPSYQDPESIYFSDEELALRKLRAGWNEEVNRHIMEPLFTQGKMPIVSMGDQRPPEALIPGAHIDIKALMKGNFAQVTNPPTDKKRERAYMSLRTFLGSKPPLDQLEKTMVQGFVLPTPVINNHEIALLCSHPILRSDNLNTRFNVSLNGKGMRERMAQIAHAAVESVRNGTTFLVLSDLYTKDGDAPIPAFIITRYVHQALLKAGLRRQVSIGMQSSTAFTVQDIAQIISIGGADVVNPYLSFTPTADDQKNRDEFRQKCQTYQHAVSEALLDCMAPMGILTISAYRGLNGFTAIGFDTELSELLGISSPFGGIGLDEIAIIVATQYQQPKPQGLGRFDQDSEQRIKIWDPLNVRGIMAQAQGKPPTKWNPQERINAMKSGNVRGQFRLSPSRVWTDQNPMHICILGAGAAAFYLAASLLEKPHPFRILIIEENHVNPFGLVGNGIAPDHAGTKKQGLILRAMLKDPRVHYFGGISIGHDVSLDMLRTTYPCIVDCRGAPIDNKLGIPGETLPRVVSASVVWSGYNNKFNPRYPVENDWTFFHESKYPDIGVIGNGNVAADVARILLSDPETLKTTSISRLFLSKLRERGPNGIHLFARGGPHQTKISLHELEQLEKLPGLFLTATFDEKHISLEKLTDTEKKYYDFFLKFKDRPVPSVYTKRLHFYFNYTPEAFTELKNGVEAKFKVPNGETRLMPLRAVIVSIGSQAHSMDHVDNHQVFACGWAMGQGGKLGMAERSALETSQAIAKLFTDGIFHNTLLPPGEQAWQSKSTVREQEQCNLLDYLSEGFTIDTIQGFHQALRYQKPAGVPVIAPTVKEKSVTVTTLVSPSASSKAESGRVVLFDPVSQGTVSYPASGDESLLTILQREGNAPPHQCNGDLQCGECAIQVLEGEVPKPTRKEALQLEANGKALDTYLLACGRQMKTLGGMVFSSPNPLPQESKMAASGSTINRNDG